MQNFASYFLSIAQALISVLPLRLGSVSQRASCTKLQKERTSHCSLCFRSTIYSSYDVYYMHSFLSLLLVTVFSMVTPPFYFHAHTLHCAQKPVEHSMICESPHILVLSHENSALIIKINGFTFAKLLNNTLFFYKVPPH